jgi:iron complex transport system ATP-binding protein
MIETAAEGLVVRDLSVGYRGQRVVENLSLHPIPHGQTVSLVGPNAAGKSTLLRAMAGLLPASGSVVLDGRELVGRPLGELARQVTYMPQTLPQGVALSVLETVIGALRASPAGQSGRSGPEPAERSMAVLERIGIGRLAMRGIDQLSGGQRQLAALAQALVREPELLLLDEPTSALDLYYQLRVLDLVRELAAERGMIVVIVLHDLQAAARASDQVVVLSQGRVVAQGPAAEAITPEILGEVYRVSSRIDHCERGSLRIMVDDVI